MDKDIKILIKRFMEGETTMTEEQQIADYLRTHICSTPEERTLKAMFGWFDSGMLLDQDNNPKLNNEEEQTQPSLHKPLLKWMGVAIVAAVVALAIVIAWPIEKQKMIADNAKLESMPGATTPVSVDTMALDTVQTLTPIKKTVRPNRSKYRDQPAPPKVYYAKTMADTINSTDNLLTEKVLDELKRNQDEWMRQMEEQIVKQNIAIDLYMAVLDAGMEETEEQEVY